MTKTQTYDKHAIARSVARMLLEIDAVLLVSMIR